MLFECSFQLILCIGFTIAGMWLKVPSHRYRLYNGLMNEVKCMVCCYDLKYRLFYGLLYCLGCFGFVLYCFVVMI